MKSRTLQKLKICFAVTLAGILTCGLSANILLTPGFLTAANASDALNNLNVDLTQVDHDQLGALTLTYKDTENNQPLNGVNLKLYRIAQMQLGFPANPTYAAVLKAAGWEEFTANFQNGAHSTSAWDKIATTIADLLKSHSLAAGAETKTNSSGNAKFTQLPTGLYLLTADSYLSTDKQYRYLFQPAILTLPQVNPAESGGSHFNYQVSLTPKINKEKLGEDVTYQVVKHWNDASNTQYRGKKITVEILRDGKLYSTQTLSEENQWAYSWESPANLYEWTVVEKDSGEYYTVSNDRRATTFIITNTLKPSVPPHLSKTGVNTWIPWAGAFSLSLGIILIGMKQRKKRSKADEN